MVLVVILIELLSRTILLRYVVIARDFAGFQGLVIVGIALIVHVQDILVVMWSIQIRS